MVFHCVFSLLVRKNTEMIFSSFKSPFCIFGGGFRVPPCGVWTRKGGGVQGPPISSYKGPLQLPLPHQSTHIWRPCKSCKILHRCLGKLRPGRPTKKSGPVKKNGKLDETTTTHQRGGGYGRQGSHDGGWLRRVEPTQRGGRLRAARAHGRAADPSGAALLLAPGAAPPHQGL